MLQKKSRNHIEPWSIHEIPVSIDAIWYMLVGSRKEYALETNLKIIWVDCVQMEEYILWKRFLRRFSSMNNQYVAIDSVDNTGHKYIFVSLQIVEIIKRKYRYLVSVSIYCSTFSKRLKLWANICSVRIVHVTKPR